MEKIMEELIEKLNYHTKLYDEGHPEISDQEWDDLYFKLITLENKYGVLPNSPTQKVNWEPVSELQKVKHNHLMLSLDKTKNLEDVEAFVGDKEYLVMAKMDGLTCSLRYINGRLVSAETRGNGEVGENILHNARVIANIPNVIPYDDEIVIDGEIICDYHSFNEFFSKDYKNPRNFAAGKVRVLDPMDCAKADLKFVAWDVIKGFEEETLYDTLNSLRGLFTIVPFVEPELPLEECIEKIKDRCKVFGYPIDGCVIKFNDIEYGESLGHTAHHFNNAIAYKFYDEMYETNLIDIDWTMGRTGVLTPVAVFNPIEIDGTEVSRASLHNVSIMQEVLGPAPWAGQKIWVSKRNMIIPQVEKAEKEMPENVTASPMIIPEVCPICGGNTLLKCDLNTINLVCDNPNCEGKLINVIDHFCSKKGLDIKGLSKATLEKLLDWGLIEHIDDIYTLYERRNEWINKPGFGEKSVDRILASIEQSRVCELEDFISSLGIPNIGKTVSKQIVEYVDSYEDFRTKIDDGFDFTTFKSFGPVMSNAILTFDYTLADRLAKHHLNITKTIEEEKAQDLEGKTFVVTGKLKTFKNRDELSAAIAARGGKVVGSISGKTDYLINNDTTSTSAKNKKAQELGIPIISEEEFLKL